MAEATERRVRAARGILSGGGESNDPNETPAPHTVPYTPLGIHDGQLCTLTRRGHFLMIAQHQLQGPNALTTVFEGDHAALCQLYPKFAQRKDGRWVAVPGTYNLRHACADFARRCAGQGAFDPARQIRGPGAWSIRDKNGARAVVLHAGDALFREGGRKHACGQIDGLAYPIASARPSRPAPDRVTPGTSLAAWYVEQFGRWSWRHQSLEPILLFGWLCAALIGGTLSRPPALGIAGRGSWGKHALLEWLESAMGDWLTVATEADPQFIRVLQGFEARALMVATPGPPGPPVWRGWPYGRRVLPLIPARGARIAADNVARVLRWRGDHGYLDLRLASVPGGDLASLPDSEACARRLPLLLRRMLDQAVRLHAEAIPAWLALIRERDTVETETARTLATLLAASWVARFDEPPTAADCDALDPALDELLLAEYADHLDDWQKMLSAVFDLMIRPRNVTLRALAAIGAGWGDAEEADMVEESSYRRPEERAITIARNDPAAKHTRHLLGSFGITIVGTVPGYRQIGVAAQATARDEMLAQQTAYQRLRDQGIGIIAALRQAPRAEDGGPRHFPGLGARRCVLLPLDLVLGELISENSPDSATSWRATE